MQTILSTQLWPVICDCGLTTSGPKALFNFLSPSLNSQLQLTLRHLSFEQTRRPTP